jgi:hypothetical protein
MSQDDKAQEEEYQKLTLLVAEVRQKNLKFLDIKNNWNADERKLFSDGLRYAYHTHPCPLFTFILGLH